MGAYRKFRRPSIDLDADPKTWERRSALDLRIGAMIPNYGLITKITITGAHAFLEFSSDKTMVIPTTEEIYSFQ